MNIYKQISELIDIENMNLSQTEERILMYLHSNMENVEGLGVRDIADKCYCSTAAIHRFVQKFGCSGFKDFKTQISTARALEAEVGSKFGKEISEMARYVDSLDVSDFTANFRKLKGKRVYIFGSGGSFVSASYLARVVNEYGIDATAFSPFERGGMRNLADAVIFISNTGDTKMILDQVKICQVDNTPTYAITKRGSILADNVRYKIVHDQVFDRNIHIERESQLMIIMIIEKLIHELLT